MPPCRSKGLYQQASCPRTACAENQTSIGKDDDTNFPLLLSRKTDGCIKAYSAAHVVAPTNLNVMIIGKSGVGKEPLAQEICDESLRRDKPCVMMDCGTLHYLALNNDPKQQLTLLDAVTTQFRKTQGGTVILDNIQYRSPDMQSWSGNIREVKHVVRVAVLKSRGEIIISKELDFDTPTTGAHVQFKLKTSDEKSKITAAIAHANGNLTKAANLLGISHRTLWKKRKEYGLK